MRIADWNFDNENCDDNSQNDVNKNNSFLRMVVATSFIGEKKKLEKKK